MPVESGVRVLVSSEAWERYRDRIIAAAPGARRDTSRPEVAWLSVDVLRGDARPFLETMRASRALRWVHSAGAGGDHPMFRELLDRGVRLSTSHVNNISIAEYVLRAVLERFQRTDLWRAARADRAWRYHEFREVSGTTWIVLGCGAIGCAVAERARAFGARVVGVRRHPDGSEPVDEMVEPAAVAGVLPDADVVVLAAPATAETHHLVDRRFLARMKEGSVLVNVARGTLVDEQALLEALNRGVPDWAVLDVLAPEPPPPDSPLWAHPSVELTPHSSSGGSGRFDRGADLFADNLARFSRDEPLLNEVRR